MADSFLFYDLETFGTDPRRTRIAQFAAIRTDAALNEIEAPIDLFMQPADDLLPSPDAALVTGITPQHARRHGLCEAAAFARIHDAMAQPDTCSLGYNSLRFDDEFIRYGLYRNFHDPYAREWRHGNSRWDLLDVMRLAHALRPDGLVWRQRDDGGGTSFKLEHLAEDNGLREGMAHEALSDVRALIALARRLRTAQPRLWDYALTLRDRKRVLALLDPHAGLPVLHISQRYPAARLCAAPVLPLTPHPSIGNRVIVLDLLDDPQALIALGEDVDALAERVFTPRAALPDGTARIGLKEVHANRSPVLVHWNHLRAEDFVRLRIAPERIAAHVEAVRPHLPRIAETVRRVYARRSGVDGGSDADAALYDGFIPAADSVRMAEVRSASPEALQTAPPTFQDARLNTLLLRYRARNWPETLSARERAQWEAYRRARLLGEEGLGELTLPAYRQRLAALRVEHAADTQACTLLDALEAWGATIEASLPAPVGVA